MTAYFSAEHPLADVAARHCVAESHARPLVGGLACGSCWELAIRNDERVVIEYDLPRELKPDPDYIDEIAVELACRGEDVELTPAERIAAMRRLAGRGLTPNAIAKRLHTRSDVVAAAIAAPDPTVVNLPTASPAHAVACAA